MIFESRISSETDRQKRLFDQKISKKRQVNRMDSCDSHGRSTSIGREPENMQEEITEPAEMEKAAEKMAEEHEARLPEGQA